jgi:RHS repeat-associated protein
LDAGTGFTFLRARFYNSSFGRFFQRDTFAGDYGRPLSLNRWAYANANPILYTDPSGKGVCFYGTDPVTGACRPAPWASILPPSLAQVAQPSISPQQTIGVTILAVVCYVGYQIFKDAVPQTQPQTQLQVNPIERLYTLPESDPEKQPTTTPFGPVPIPSQPPGKHITLGLSVVYGQPAIVNFTFQLRQYLGTKEVYYYKDWQTARLTSYNSQSADSPMFNLAFAEATSKAVQIHFNLDGIDDPDSYAETYGSSGSFPPDTDEYATAVELYLIKANGLCAKTEFYRGGSTWGSLRPVPDEKFEFCGE